MCSIAECGDAVKARGWCSKHYQRWVKHGDPAYSPPQTRCSVNGCERPHKGHGLCKLHYRRVRATGSPFGIRKGGPPRIERPSYATAHGRTVSARGPARENPCAHCGGTARDWAYDHDDPQELHDVVRGMVLRYSADPEHYLPLCKSCHARFDRAAA